MKSCEINLKMIVPSSVGILAITSGICFFIWSKNLRKKKQANEIETKIKVDDSHCACCLKPFFIGRGVQCTNCNSRSCRKGCSYWDINENIWLCLFCHHRRSRLKNNEAWFESFGRVTSICELTNKFDTAKSKVDTTEAEHVALNSELDLAAGGYENGNTMENVRETIEKIVENLVGNVDNTSINRLYKHSAYDRLFTEYSRQLAEALTHLATTLQLYIANKPAIDTPSMAQTALRELVERAVDEARKLPGLGDSVTTTMQDTTSIDKQSYEDLLATAILNKVIEKYQEEYVDGNSNVLNKKSSRKNGHVKCKSMDNANVDEDNKSLESSMSSDECNSDCNENKIRKRRTRQNSLSLTIEEQIEEVTTLYTSDDESGCMKTNVLNFQCARRVPFPEFGMDIVDPSQESSDDSHDETDEPVHVDHVTPIESWEENWLFQKKKISIQSDPITMLVPNPSADYRALIGDKDAEDTSDLSEFSAHSDDEIEDDLIEAINCIIPKSSNTDVKSTSEMDIKFTKEKNKKCDEVNDIMHSDFNDVTSGTVNTEQNFKNTELIESNKSKINSPINSSTISSSFDKEDTFEDDNDQLDNIKLYNVQLINSNNLNNEEVPKTPAPSPLINSFCENDSTAMEACEVERLNEKLASIDQNIDESTDIVRESRDTIPKSNLHLTSQFIEQEKLYENSLQFSSPPRPGTIAEREHKKWENAAPIQNNPYSQENIEKRLLERQYSRRSSDVNGNSAVLPAAPCSALQIVIGANRPDIKRFGRDYYINESKSPTGERPQQLGTSISSRPSSSLSHHSHSTGSDFEQQVSHGLDTFEKSSLRGNLRRRTYRGTNVTPHFVINPLIHMDITDEIKHNTHHIESNDNWEFYKTSETQQDELDNATNWNDSINSLNDFETNSLNYFENSFLHSTVNPLYSDENELSRRFNENTVVDRDSGMYSTDYNDLEFFPPNHVNSNVNLDKNNSLTLNFSQNNLNKIREDQIHISNGKKYWPLNTQKFQTFGGIKRRKIKINPDNDNLSDKNLSNIDKDFHKFKFQTFGGIKYKNKIDETGFCAFKTSRARPSIKLFTKSPKHSMQSNHRYFHTASELSLKRAVLDDRENLKLEPPLVPVIIEKKFATLSDIKKQRHKNTEKF